MSVWFSLLFVNLFTAVAFCNPLVFRNQRSAEFPCVRPSECLRVYGTDPHDVARFGPIPPCGVPFIRCIRTVRAAAANHGRNVQRTRQPVPNFGPAPQVPNMQTGPPRREPVPNFGSAPQVPNFQAGPSRPSAEFRSPAVTNDPAARTQIVNSADTNPTTRNNPTTATITTRKLPPVNSVLGFNVIVEPSESRGSGPAPRALNSPAEIMMKGFIAPQVPFELEPMLN